MIPDRFALSGKLAATPAGEKLAVAASGLLLALLLPPWPFALANIAVCLAAALLWARLRPALFFAWALAPIGFLAASGLALALQTRPEFPWLTLSESGLREALLASLRAFAASLWLIWLAFTTPVGQIAYLMGRVPGAAILAEVLLLIHRQLLLLIDTAFAMQAAQSARLGYRDRKSSLVSLGRLSACLLPRAMARAQRMEIGLMARNLDATPLPACAPKKSRPAFLLACGMAFLSLLVWGLS
jgi:cobalt/nickel transport system permease protein